MRILLAVLSILFVLSAIASIPMPLMEDQTTFLHGARALVAGQLYTKFWDLKPPGIFIAYALGRGPVSIHILEVLAITLLGVALFFTVRRTHGPAVLTALLTCSTYFVIADHYLLGQVEGLLNVTLFAFIACLAAGRLSLAGLAAGVCLLLKLQSLVIFGAIYLVYVMLNGIGRSWLAVLAGATGPILATVTWFWIGGGLPELWYTLAIAPVELSREARPMERIETLRLGFQGFRSMVNPVLIACLVGLPCALTR